MNFIPEPLYKGLVTEGDAIDKMLPGYISCLKPSKPGANEPGANYAIRGPSSDFTLEDDFLSRRTSNNEYRIMIVEERISSIVLRGS